MVRPSYPSDDVDKLLLRFPEGMRDVLKQHAQDNGRSLNAEIIHRLQSSLHGLGRETSIDEIAHTFLRRLADGPYVPGQTNKFNDLYLASKKIEAEAVRKLMDGAQRLLENAKTPKNADDDT